MELISAVMFIINPYIAAANSCQHSFLLEMLFAGRSFGSFWNELKFSLSNILSEQRLFFAF